METYLDFKESENNKKILKYEKDLHNFLMSLEFEIIKTIQIIMLIGRDNNSQNENIEPILRFEKYKSKSIIGEHKYN